MIQNTDREYAQQLSYISKAKQIAGCKDSLIFVESELRLTRLCLRFSFFFILNFMDGTTLVEFWIFLADAKNADEGPVFENLKRFK